MFVISNLLNYKKQKQWQKAIAFLFVMGYYKISTVIFVLIIKDL